MPPFLTETAAKAVKPAEKARKIYDERGLFLFVPPTGARLADEVPDGGREKLSGRICQIPGNCYFAVRAYTSSGTESANSNVTIKVVQWSQDYSS